jgi:hypothetical protein
MLEAGDRNITHTWQWPAFLLAIAVILFGAPSNSRAAFTNGGFETGPAGSVPPAPWVLSNFLNPGITIQTPQTYAGLNLASSIASHAAPVALTVINSSAAGPLSQVDPDLGAAASLRWPLAGNQAVIVNQQSSTAYAHGQNVNQLSQTMTTGAGDVDPADGQIHIRFALAPVLENPGHTADQQPYVYFEVVNMTNGNSVLYSRLIFSNQPGVPWKSIVSGTLTYTYTDWQMYDIAPGSAALAPGDMVSLKVIVAGCSLGGHMGKAYVDSVGSTFPFLNVEASGPRYVNAGSNITYTYVYANGSASAVSGAIIDAVTPPNTTFQSMTPPSGFTCMTPAVGTAGIVVCSSSSPLPSGARGTMNITLNISPGTSSISNNNYDIHATGTALVIGPPVDTVTSCSLDAECPGGNWCYEITHVCTPKLANGTLVPNDPPHTNPVLNGACTAVAASLVCVSGTCDTADNKCGYSNGDGPCSVANAGTVCRSGTCDADLKCGYANSDGPCTAVNAGTVCRSGACSVNSTCEPAGGCNVDADCSGGNWCYETTHVCTPKLANGSPVPNDPPHASPVLNGACTAAAASLVCVSSTCDTADNKCGYVNGDGPCSVASGGIVCRSGTCDVDLKCGYANSDGPCTAVNAGTVCRSGACSVNSTCEPVGGCNVDADCSGGDGCNVSLHLCVPRPTVTAISPPSGSSAGGTSVTISGTNLTGATVVNFDSSAGTVTQNLDSQIIAVSPAGTAGQIADVTVTTPGGISAVSSADQFTYTQDQARNATTGNYYALLVTALSTASTQVREEIRAYNSQFGGDFVLNKGVALKGGYDGAFLIKSGTPTTLSGSLTVQAGDSTVENVAVTGNVSVKGGSLRVNGVAVMPLVPK